MSEQGKLLPFTRAVGTVRLAHDFARAAVAGVGQDSTSHSMVPYFLAGHAWELAYKSILMAQGVSEKRLRQIGHDLVECRAAAAEGAADLLATTSPESVAALEMIAPFYRAKAFEYVEPGYYSLPDLEVAGREALATVELIRDWVERVVRSRLRSSDVTNPA